MNCLIIDDEPLVRRSLSRALIAKGHSCEVAVDGNDGVEKWLQLQPDLVFLDVLMPGLSGPEVLEEMNGKSESLVILMSAYAGEHNIQTAQQLGADLFIPKPFEDVFAVVTTAEELASAGK